MRNNIIILKNAYDEKYQRKTEYEVMVKIEERRLNKSKKCKFCGSPSVEIFDISINGYPLYNFDRLTKECISKQRNMLIFNIDKKGPKIILKTGGNNLLELTFFKNAVQEIINIIGEMPFDYFIPQIMGNFFICVTGQQNSININTVRVERFRSHGLTRDEILDSIQTLVSQNENPVNTCNLLIERNIKDLGEIMFKGGLFKSWFYIDDEESIKLGYSGANVYLDLDEKTIIAFRVSDHESPRNFIDNNKYDNFIVDIKIKPYIIHDKTIYFVKRC